MDDTRPGTLPPDDHHEVNWAPRERAGLAVAVGDAVPEVKDIAHYTTRALAGHGAIREAVELILRSKGIWAEMIDKARA